MADAGTISSLGIGSGFNSADIVSKLMDIERIPLQRMAEKQDEYEAKISALGSLKSALSSFQSTLSGLTTGASFQATSATSSNEALVKATGTSGGVAGTYNIEVTQLAQRQKLVATGQADATAAIGTGTLTIDLGTISGGTFDSATGTYTGATFTPNGNGSVSITIDSTNNTLEGIRDAINAADAGVTAAIVNDGDPANPYRLVLTSANSGSSESIRIAVTGDAALSDLLAQDPEGVQNLSEKVTAQDAQFSVDGIAITKASNTVTDVIDGVTLELQGLTGGTPVSVSTERDMATAKESVQDFVEAYNALYDEFKTQMATGADGGESGALASDSATRMLLDNIRDVLTTAPTGITGSYTSLNSIGVTFQQDGSLAVDETVLETAIQTDSKNVTDLFSSADGYATRLDSVLTDTLAYNGIIATRTEGYEARIDTLEDRQANEESRLARIENRLRAQFTALDVMLASLNATSNALGQQLAALTGQTGQ